MIGFKLNIDDFTDVLQRGAFTPFLGAGVSSFRDEIKEINNYSCIRQMRNCRNITTYFRIGKLVHFIENEKSAQELTFIKNFLNDFDIHKNQIMQCKNLYKKNEALINKLYETPLLEFQKLLLKIILILSQKIGERFAKGEITSLDKDAAYVNLGENTQEQLACNLNALLEIIKQLKTISTCETCQENEDLNKECSDVLKKFFRPKEVEVRIKLLIAFLIVNVEDKILNDLKSLGNDLFIITKNRRDEAGKASITELEWLKHLLWHSFRFDDPQLPSAQELSFLISIEKMVGLPAIGDLPEVAERADLSNVKLDPQYISLKVIERFFKYCNEKNMNQIPTIYETFALLLKQQYNSENSYIDSDRPRKNSAAALTEKTPSKPIVAFTTNYDNNLENAFNQNQTDYNSSYHIVFPAKKKYTKATGSQKPSNSTAGSIQWFVSTIEGSAYKSCQIIDSQYSISDFIKRDMIGPIIIKLHGAPLENLGEHKKKFEHFVIRSESNYLESLTAQDSLDIPLDFLDIARNSQNDGFHILWFYGYSVSDWNIRIALYKQLHKENSQEHRYATAKFNNFYKDALFRRLMIQKEKQDLSEVCKTLNAAIENLPIKQGN